MIYRESPGDWRGETNDVLHRLELIEQRDGALDFRPYAPRPSRHAAMAAAAKSSATIV